MEKITKDFDFVTWNVKSFRGIGGFTKKNTTKETKTGKLLNDLATYLSGFDKSLRHLKPSAVFVVLDNDKRDQAAFARQLKELAARRNITIDHVFCIAVEEVEAWLLGDREAVIKAYPRAKRAALDTYQQDSICRTWECLADVIYHGGRERMKKGCPTYGGARQAQARVGGEHRAAHVPGCKCIAEFSIFFERDPKADFAGNRVSV